MEEFGFEEGSLESSSWEKTCSGNWELPLQDRGTFFRDNGLWTICGIIIIIESNRRKTMEVRDGKIFHKELPEMLKKRLKSMSYEERQSLL